MGFSFLPSFLQAKAHFVAFTPLAFLKKRQQFIKGPLPESLRLFYFLAETTISGWAESLSQGANPLSCFGLEVHSLVPQTN